MDHDANRRIPRSLYGPRYGEHDRQQEKQDAKAETEVKEAMKQSLDEPSAPTERRLLARLDEPRHQNSSPTMLSTKNGSQNART
jgi:hypothetical protein